MPGQPEAWGCAASASIREEISATPGNLGQEKARLGHNLDRMDKRVATQWRHNGDTEVDKDSDRHWPTIWYSEYSDLIVDEDEEAKETPQ